jgi:DNA-binding response OmpR family regulator
MNKKRILLVEDEEDMVYAIKLELESHNFEVATAKDGLEGLEKARHDMPDLIILDIMLPKMYGYKVCRMLKFDAKYKHIPIIMLTSKVQKEDEKIGFEVGADAYITKPFEPQKLLAKMQELIKE